MTADLFMLPCGYVKLDSGFDFAENIITVRVELDILMVAKLYLTGCSWSINNEYLTCLTALVLGFH